MSAITQESTVIKDDASSHLARIRPAPCSFGVEMEFLVAVLQDGAVDPMAHIEPNIPPVRVEKGASLSLAEAAAHRHVAQVLASAGLQVWDTPGTRHRDEILQVKAELRKEPFYMRRKTAARLAALKAAHWVVARDGSVKSDGLAHPLFWVGVEVQSPALWEDDMSMRHVERAVLAIRQGVRSRINQTCGLHVHVGRGDAQFELDELRRVAATLWAIEPMMSRLHPAYRGRENFSHVLRSRWRNKIAAGVGTAVTWAARATDKKQEVNRVLLANRNYETLDDLEIEVSPELANKVGVRLLENSFGSDVYRRMASDLAGIHGTPFNRPHTNVKIEEPEGSARYSLKRSRYEQQAASSEDSVDQEDMDSADDGRLLASPQGTKDESLPDINILKIVSDNVREGYAAAVKAPQATETHQPTSEEQWTQKTKQTTGAPLRVFPDLSKYIPHKLLIQPTDYAMLQEKRRVNGIYQRPRLPEIWPRKRYFPPRALRSLTCDYTGYASADYPGHDPTSMWWGVKELLGADISAEQIRASLMYEDQKYASYNFSRVGHFEQPSLLSQTIEFREAAASLDPAWIRTWATVAVGVVNWACRVNMSEFMQVMQLVSLVQSSDQVVPDGSKVEYDIVSFLEDIGLPQAARFCLKRLERGEEAMIECPTFEMYRGN
ncbi:hypothetical protein Cpir12675_005391 [Ceratocystis pirilliformis]|uniref:Amidoligase enzyme n=1 Tax=Ceratocystis pirilliformis TaxID=259994 RepID=A0ABR3YRF5_9PEZI